MTVKEVFALVPNHPQITRNGNVRRQWCYYCKKRVFKERDMNISQWGHFGCATCNHPLYDYKKQDQGEE